MLPFLEPSLQQGDHLSDLAVLPRVVVDLLPGENQLQDMATMAPSSSSVSWISSLVVNSAARTANAANSAEENLYKVWDPVFLPWNMSDAESPSQHPLQHAQQPGIPHRVQVDCLDQANQ